ncbi:hypothetical protein P7C70_g8842, partial [Phenoliferia sp. Uapishka_3]
MSAAVPHSTRRRLALAAVPPSPAPGDNLNVHFKRHRKEGSSSFTRRETLVILQPLTLDEQENPIAPQTHFTSQTKPPPPDLLPSIHDLPSVHDDRTLKQAADPSPLSSDRSNSSPAHSTPLRRLQLRENYNSPTPLRSTGRNEPTNTAITTPKPNLSDEHFDLHEARLTLGPESSETVEIEGLMDESEEELLLEETDGDEASDEDNVEMDVPRPPPLQDLSLQEIAVELDLTEVELKLEQPPAVSESDECVSAPPLDALISPESPPGDIEQAPPTSLASPHSGDDISSLDLNDSRESMEDREKAVLTSEEECVNQKTSSDTEVEEEAEVEQAGVLSARLSQVIEDPPTRSPDLAAATSTPSAHLSHLAPTTLPSPPPSPILSLEPASDVQPLSVPPSPLRDVPPIPSGSTTPSLRAAKPTAARLPPAPTVQRHLSKTSSRSFTTARVKSVVSDSAGAELRLPAGLEMSKIEEKATHAPILASVREATTSDDSAAVKSRIALPSSTSTSGPTRLPRSVSAGLKGKGPATSLQSRLMAPTANSLARSVGVPAVTKPRLARPTPVPTTERPFSSLSASTSSNSSFVASGSEGHSTGMYSKIGRVGKVPFKRSAAGPPPTPRSLPAFSTSVNNPSPAKLRLAALTSVNKELPNSRPVSLSSLGHTNSAPTLLQSHLSSSSSLTSLPFSHPSRLPPAPSP